MSGDVGYISRGLTSVIIPVLDRRRHWNYRYRLVRPRGFEQLLDDLGRATCRPLEVIIVCNGSAGLHPLIAGHPRVDKYCLNSVNAGVSRAWNMGAMLAEGEFLCFINDDVELAADSLERLRAVLESDGSIGEIGPCGGRFIDGEAGERLGQERLEDADEISGFLFMARREVFDRVGGFDVRFTPAGFEEIDFSFKVREAGWRCVVMPGIDARHHNQSGVSVIDAPIHYLNHVATRGELHERNKRIFLDKWAPARSLGSRA